MKTPRPRRLPALVRAVFAAVCFVPALPAAHVAAASPYLYWDPGLTKTTTGGGTGTWDATTANWDNLSTGGTDVVYNANAGPIFQGTAGTVNLNANLSTGYSGPIFSTSGYVLQDAPGTSYALTLTGFAGLSSEVSGTTTVNVPLTVSSTGAFSAATGGTLAIGGAITTTSVLPVGSSSFTGTVSLSGNNTLSAGLNVNYGILTAASNTALGIGNVTLAASTQLTLNAEVVLTNQTTAKLTLTSTTSSTVNLLGTDIQDTVASLVIGSVAQPAGTYGAVGDALATYQSAEFTGMGVLVVTSGPSAVPEPSVWALLGVGAAGLGLARRRRASRA